MNRVALFSLGVPSNLFASTAEEGVINNPHFMANGAVIIYTNGTRTSVPSCAASQPGRFALDATSEGGRVQLAGLLMAFASGKQVTIYGTDSCTAYGDTETVNYFRIVE